MVSEVGYKPTLSNRKGGNDDTIWLSAAALNAKPLLETIFKKTLHAAPPRLHRIMFDVIRDDPKIVYKKGTELHIADTLSYDCTPRPEESDIEVQMVICMTKSGRKKYGTATANNGEMQVLMQFSKSGFTASQVLRSFWMASSRISISRNRLL
jgi:hypothetical protein